MTIDEATDDELKLLSRDIVWGVLAISEVIRKNERQTYYMLQTGQLPAKKIGAQWVASHRALLSFLLEAEPPARKQA